MARTKQSARATINPSDMSYLCGCYYHVVSTDYYVRMQKHYLPLLDSEVHSAILSTTSRTVLKQTFTNPSPHDAIKECTYTFPLYDGVSVVSFTCRIGDKVLQGLVKEKVKAKQIFDDAVAKGETAGLLEQAPQASDVFSTKLGNIPAGQSVIVEITYIGELKHHETDGIRFTIPTKIAPRYGSGPNTGSTTDAWLQAFPDEGKGGIRIVVDVNMPEGSFIRGVQSPSHPIAVSMGAVSTAANADPTMSKASATLSLGSAALDKDFVLIVQSKDIGIPKAILETHPTIPNHRALMATLVPKFSLPPSRPEIVFVADRSGSMNGNIPFLISAMNVFLKSLPAGIKFNICSFGTSCTFLWPQSKTYTAETLEEATNHVQTFSANYGGTETFNAIKQTIDRRFTDLPLEIMLLTDGDIWQQEDLFKYVNQQVESTKGKIRIFPLGIGNGVSHALIEGLARAGNGFSQAVQLGERLDNSVVRMLRGALSPHITDYTLEVKYEKEDDDDFELIDKVTEGMKVLLSDEDKSIKSPQALPTKPTISLFDPSVDPEKDVLKGLKDSKFHLPNIPYPKLLQAPHKIPSLFAFSRTSVYLLMSPSTIQRKPTAIVLRATSEHGPLALEIPIEILATPAATIHQLAAKKAVQDLEEGRGWIFDAKDQNGTLIKDRHASCFDELVQKEAVRLGEKFQVAGKWCSFVAVAANDKEIEEKQNRAAALKASGEEFKEAVSVDDGKLFSLSSKSCMLFGTLNANITIECDYELYRPDSELLDVAVLRSPVSPTMKGASHAPRRQLASMAARRSAPAPNVCIFSSHRGRSISSRNPQLTSLFQAQQQAQQQVQQQMFFSPARGRAPQAQQMVMRPQPTGSSSSHQAQGVQYTGFDSSYQNPAALRYSPAPSSSSFGGAAYGSAPSWGSGNGSPFDTQSAAPAGGLGFGSPASLGGAPKAFANAAPLAPAGAMSGAGVSFSAFSSEQPQQSGSVFGSKPNIGRGPSNLFGGIRSSSSSTSAQPAKPSTIGAGSSLGVTQSGGLFGASPTPTYRASTTHQSRQYYGPTEIPQSTALSGGLAAAISKKVAPGKDWSKESTSGKVLALIALQAFDGYWPGDNAEVGRIIGLGSTIKNVNLITEEKNIWATFLVVKFLEEKCADEEGTWALVVEKARIWLAGMEKDQAAMEELEKKALEIVQKTPVTGGYDDDGW
jgi:hypothetical protein